MSIDIASAVASAKRRLHDLQTFQLPRLEKCDGPLGLHRELADELKGDLEGVRRNLEVGRAALHCSGWSGLINSSVESSQRAKSSGTDGFIKSTSWIGHYTSELGSDGRGGGAAHASLRMAYREALVSSKRAIASKARSRRHELLLSRESGTGDAVDPSLEAQKAKPRTGTR
jgi:protein transport protein SEC20